MSGSVVADLGPADGRSPSDSLARVERELGLAGAGSDATYLRFPTGHWLIRPVVLMGRMMISPRSSHIVPIFSAKGMTRQFRVAGRAGFCRLPLRADVVNVRPAQMDVSRAIGLYLKQRAPKVVKTTPLDQGMALLDREVKNSDTVREVGVLRAPLCEGPHALGQTAYMVSEYVDAETATTRTQYLEIVNRLVPDLINHYLTYGVERSPANAHLDQQFFDDLDNALSKLSGSCGGFTGKTMQMLRRTVGEEGDLLLSFCHSDLNLSHIGFRRSDGKIVLIDWGAASVKPVGYDMARLADIRIGVHNDLFEVAATGLSRLIKCAGERGTMPAHQQIMLGVVHRLKWWFQKNHQAVERGMQSVAPRRFEDILTKVSKMAAQLDNDRRK